jgi:hypothetical protein
MLLSSCKTALTDFSGFWVEKKRENDRIIIKKKW